MPCQAGKFNCRVHNHTQDLSSTSQHLVNERCCEQLALRGPKPLYALGLELDLKIRTDLCRDYTAKT